MLQIKWNVLGILHDRDDCSPKSMSYARLVKHVGVSIAKITDNGPRPINERKNILDDFRLVPNLIDIEAAKSQSITSLVQRE